MGCDYNIIVHLEKFSQFALKTSFICKFSGNSTEVAKWVIVILCGPRACTRSLVHALGRKSLVQRRPLRRDITRLRARRRSPRRRLWATTAPSPSPPGRNTQMCRLAAKEANFSKWSIMNKLAASKSPTLSRPNARTVNPAIPLSCTSHSRRPLALPRHVTRRRAAKRTRRRGDVTNVTNTKDVPGRTDGRTDEETDRRRIFM